MTYDLAHPISVISALPYLCHFRPRQQLVLVAIHESGAGLGATPISLDQPDPLAAAAEMLDAWPAYVERVIVCLFTEALVDHATDVLIADCIDLLSDRDLAIVDVLLANDRAWRSALCAAGDCCADGGNAFAAEPPLAHPATHVLDIAFETQEFWRRTMWGVWETAILEAADGCIADPDLLMSLELSLNDIRLRDALLAQAARTNADHVRGFRALLAAIASHSLVGLAVPAWTCRAALEYLDAEYARAQRTVEKVLAVADYSLARLLNDGLRHGAPASLLAASFGHFDPESLLLGTAEAA